MTIKVLRRAEIDDDKWNNCIAASINSNVYALTWYLDAVTDKKWQALVANDYEIVLPFLKKWKYFVPYITQPFLCQRLGIFSIKKQLSSYEIESFYSKMSHGVFKIDLLTPDNVPSKSNLVIKQNHVLNLAPTYEILSRNYNRNTKRNLSFAKTIENHEITENIDLKTQIDFLKVNDPTLLLIKHHLKVEQLINASIFQKKGFILSVQENNEIRASAFFIAFGQRIYFLLCASDTRGKEIKSMYLLINYIIHKYAGQEKIFDFTGSNIKNIAQRNLGFGADVENYFQIKSNWF